MLTLVGITVIQTAAVKAKTPPSNITGNPAGGKLFIEFILQTMRGQNNTRVDEESLKKSQKSEIR